jgi:hypothetical protein
MSANTNSPAVIMPAGGYIHQTPTTIDAAPASPNSSTQRDDAFLVTAAAHQITRL